jgi:protein dithiol oxidoreductase (disulfide-forming)
MNRREFSAGAACVMGAAALGLPQWVWAQGKKPEEGQEYLTLGRRVPVEAQAPKVEVVEFFWYSCPHCNAFEPRLQAWINKLPGDVVLKRVPVAFRDDFVPQQRLYYALEALGKVDEVHAKVFHAIHKDRVSLDREDGITEWVVKQGVDKAKFTEQYNSFSVSAKARRAVQLQNAYEVQGVPAIGIAGRYYTDGTIAGNMARALEITDHLIAEVRKTR